MTINNYKNAYHFTDEEIVQLLGAYEMPERVVNTTADTIIEDIKSTIRNIGYDLSTVITEDL